jgi:hypothetical protein
MYQIVRWRNIFKIPLCTVALHPPFPLQRTDLYGAKTESTASSSTLPQRTVSRNTHLYGVSKKTPWLQPKPCTSPKLYNGNSTTLNGGTLPQAPLPPPLLQFTVLQHLLPNCTESRNPPWPTAEDCTTSGNKPHFTVAYTTIYDNTLYLPARRRCFRNYNDFQLFKITLRHISQHHYSNTILSPSHSHFVVLQHCTSLWKPLRHFRRVILLEASGTFSNRMLFSISFPPYILLPHTLSHCGFSFHQSQRSPP